MRDGSRNPTCRSGGLTRARPPCSLAAVRTPVWNLVVSNVPGPQFPLYLAGARLEANYPVSVITDGLGLNIMVMSYYGSLDFGIAADREQMRDVWKLIGWLRESLAELLPSGAGAQPELAREEPRRAGEPDPRPATG